MLCDGQLQCFFRSATASCLVIGGQVIVGGRYFGVAFGPIDGIFSHILRVYQLRASLDMDVLNDLCTEFVYRFG